MGSDDSRLDVLDLEPRDAAHLRRLGPGVFELPILMHDFALIMVEE